MIQLFFIEEFRRNREENKRFISHIQDFELQDHHLIRSLMCQILNLHHIWNSRLFQKEKDNELYDILPFDFWLDFNEQNHRESLEFLKFASDDELSEDLENDFHQSQASILQHIIKQSVYLRGRVDEILNQINHPIPSIIFA